MTEKKQRRFGVIKGGDNPVPQGPICLRNELIRCAKCGNTEEFRGYIIHSPINCVIRCIDPDNNLYDVEDISYVAGPETIEVPTHCLKCGSQRLIISNVDENKEY